MRHFLYLCHSLCQDVVLHAHCRRIIDFASEFDTLLPHLDFASKTPRLDMPGTGWNSSCQGVSSLTKHPVSSSLFLFYIFYK